MIRIVLDENIPLSLVTDFVDYECMHVISLGFAGTKNGELLARAE